VHGCFLCGCGGLVVVLLFLFIAHHFGSSSSQTSHYSTYCRTFSGVAGNGSDGCSGSSATRSSHHGGSIYRFINLCSLNFRRVHGINTGLLLRPFVTGCFICILSSSILFFGRENV